MVTYSHARGFMGQHVVFRTMDGIHHHGILQSVTPDGIYVRAVDGQSTRLAHGTYDGQASAELLGNLPQNGEVEETFFPFFFFPFFALAFLWPWAWWW